MNRWLDCVQIWYGCSLGISDDLIKFGYFFVIHFAPNVRRIPEVRIGFQLGVFVIRAPDQLLG